MPVIILKSETVKFFPCIVTVVPSKCHAFLAANDTSKVVDMKWETQRDKLIESRLHDQESSALEVG